MQHLRRHATVVLGLALTLSGATIARAANLVGGNGVYEVVVTDGELADKCGSWTASTRELHPAGPGRTLLGSVNNGFPLDFNYTTLHSYYTGTNYATRGECTPLCLFAGPPDVEPIPNGDTTVGFRLTWTFRDQLPVQGKFGAMIEFTQEVVVEGPVDGTETVENSVVRETHIVRNLSPDERFQFGLRKFWDLLVDGDWGPWLGDCQTPDTACDLSLNLTRTGVLSYPRNLVFNASPAVAACSGGLVPNEPGACGGNASYRVAATAQPPSGLIPRPHPPQVLQYNAFNFAASCWFPLLLNDDAECEPDDFNCFPPFDSNCGMALVYYYGITKQTSHLLMPGLSRTFTQYVGAFVDHCPSIITDDPSAPLPSN